jgi:hypothetical protein
MVVMARGRPRGPAIGEKSKFKEVPQQELKSQGPGPDPDEE